MTVQEKMKAYREEHRYTIKKMSQKSGASEVLLRMVEKGNVTHPKIAEMIGKAYELNQEDVYELMPENYRPGEHYNPDKYVEFVPERNDAIFAKVAK